MANFGGKGSTKEKETHIKCPKCKSNEEVYYLGSTVNHGNPYSAAADTDVDHHYMCEKCGYEWNVNV